MFTVQRTFTFDSAHKLPNYEGKCANMHGHTWTLTVIIGVDELLHHTFIMDFNTLKSIVQEHILDKLDHQVLNDVCPYYPSCEWLAWWIAHLLQGPIHLVLDRDFHLIVKLKEGEGGSASASLKYPTLDSFEKMRRTNADLSS